MTEKKAKKKQKIICNTKNKIKNKGMFKLINIKKKEKERNNKSAKIETHIKWMCVFLSCRACVCNTKLDMK